MKTETIQRWLADRERRAAVKRFLWTDSLDLLIWAALVFVAVVLVHTGLVGEQVWPVEVQP